ncbi:MAG: S8 family peptidase [Candidatus Limnocylindria bacterium]
MLSNERRRLTAAASGVALLLGAFLPAAPIQAADPASVAREQLSREHGGTPNDFVLVHERSLSTDAVGESMWAAKFIDQRTGEIHTSYRSATGAVGSVAILDEALGRKQDKLPQLDRKSDVALLAAVGKSAATKTLPVAVWLDVDVTGPQNDVRQAHPEVEWVAGRPVVGTLEAARALRGELWEARSGAYAAAAETFGTQIEQLGGKVAYASTSAPLVFVDVPAASVAALAGRAEVLSLGLENEWRTSMTSAGPGVGANWTSGSGDQGNGVRVAVVEYHNVATSGDLSGQVVASYSTTGRKVAGVHPTWVAGAIGSRSSTWAGVAPGADIVSASTGGNASPSVSTDRAIIAAADWAVAPGGGDSDVINASIGQDTATGAEEARRYFDSIGWEDGRLVVAASGNYSTFGNWDVVSPGTGYNVMTVGGVDDRNTGGVGDDWLWYAPGSNGANYRDRTDASWNRHGDYNKPNLSAPAVSVRTANGTYGDGTSVASPIVAGIAAQLIARQPSLVTWPEATRAILMAGALRRSPMPGGGYSADHEGVGSASARWSNRVLDNGPYGGWTMGAMRAGNTVTRDVAVVKGQQLRVSLAWSSHTSGGSNTDKADTLMADLDLVLRQPNGATVGSYSFDNSYETVTVTAASNGTMRITVRHDRFDAAEEPYGLAWSLTSPYSDIETSKFYGDIVWIAQRAITVGCGGDRFCPKGKVTRGQMATFLTRALDLPRASRDYFSDDNANKHESSINALAQSGITVGCGGTRFCPDGTVTREQMATFLVRGLDLPPTSRDYYADDNDSIHEARINSLAASGITRGCGDGVSTFCPRGAVLREQMAAFLRRALTH